MSEEKGVTSRGIGVTGLLGVVFVFLKLTHVIDWKWAWVTLPFWGGIALFIGISFAVVLGAVIATGIANHKGEK